MKPKSHLSSISDNSCHRCPNCQYNPCQCQCDAQTHFSSVHEDSPSTRFLYVGRSFHGQECDSGREFKDCRSDTEIHQKPSCQVLSTKPSTCVSEYSNYKQMLKQIITMSQKVLERIEKREQQTGGRMSSPPTSCSMSIHVDPVQIAVPVTIHFQRKASPSSNVLPCPSATMQRQQQQQQQPCIQQGYPQTTNNFSMPCNIKSEIECECDAPKPLMGICDDAQPPCNAISALPTFPFSAEKRNEVCVSQNKFPQENLPASKSGICDFDMICVAHLHNDPAPEPPCLPICEPVETFDCDISEQPAESLEERDDKAIQTDKRHGRMKGSKECLEADSYGHNSHLVVSADFEPRSRTLQVKISSRSLADKPPTESRNNQNPLEPANGSTLENPNADNAPIPDISTSNPADQPDVQPAPSRISGSQQRVSISNVPRQSANAMNSQSIDDQPTTPARTSVSQQRVSYSNIDPMQELLKEQELYDKPPPPVNEYECPITSQVPQSMNYPSQFRQSANNCNFNKNNEPESNEQTIFSACFDLTNPEQPAPVCCRCKRVLRDMSETSCFPKICCSKSSISMSAMASCESSLKPICPIDCEDIFYSANSGSDTEKQPKCQEKKKRKKKKKTSSSSHSVICRQEKSGLITVLERIMQVLECMSKSKTNLTRPCDRGQQTSKPSTPCSLKSLVDALSTSFDPSRNKKRRNFECLKKGQDGSSTTDYASNKSTTCSERQSVKKPCAPAQIPSKPCLIITLDPKTGYPCYSVRVGNFQSPCQEIPITDVDANQSIPSISSSHGPRGGDEPTSQLQDDEEYMEGNVLIRDEMQIINETHIKVVSTEEGQEYCYNSETEEIRIETTMPCPTIQIYANCVETQTDECFGPFPVPRAQDATELLDQLCCFHEELSESGTCTCSCQEMIYEMWTRKTSSELKFGGDIPCECDCCYCRAERNKDKTPCPACCECCRQELKALVDSVILDLEAMEMVRKQNERCNAGIEKPPKYKTSFPVSIVEVTELGKSSLYVKWTIHDGYGIGGYEIYVDGYLTNRYFNSRHEAAVVCDIDVSQPHKIALLARPKDMGKTILGAGDVFIEDEESPMPTTWAPSIYLYEPSKALDYTKCF